MANKCFSKRKATKTKHFASFPSSGFVRIFAQFASFGSGIGRTKSDGGDGDPPNNKSFSFRNWKLSWSARILGEANIYIIIFYSSWIAVRRPTAQVGIGECSRKPIQFGIRNTPGENEIMKNRWRKFNNKVATHTLPTVGLLWQRTFDSFISIRCDAIQWNRMRPMC